MRLYLTLLAVFLVGKVHAQTVPAPGEISTPATLPNPMDPNSDGWITSTGAPFTGPLDETEFELPYISIPQYTSEPAADVQVASTSCTMYDLVGDPASGAESTYYYYRDPNGTPDSGDEQVFFRFRVGKLHTNTVGLSILIDTDQKFGFASDGDPNAVVGNPGFELEVSVAYAGGTDIYVHNVDGLTTSGALKASYPISSNLQTAYALNKDPTCNKDAGFIDIYLPFSALGVSSTTPVRMVGASSETAGSMLGGNADDIAGVDGTAIASDDDQFIAVIGSNPPFTLGDDNNETPSIVDGTAATDENSGNGSAVHTVSASDPDGDALTYTIIAGNTGTAFAIGGSGQITVNNSLALNFETTPSFTLTVRVSDGTLFDDAVITINLNDLNETPLTVDATVSLDENSANGTAVHTVSASDPDGDALSYTIIGGNTATAFAIDASGQITVNDASALDFETTSSFTLTVRVSDGTLSDDAVITINLNDVNETPLAVDATVSLDENSANGTAVHTVSASDPDGDALSFSIAGGDPGNVFTINGSGQITVVNSSALDYETTSSFALRIRVQDAFLSDEAVITVNLRNVNESPSANDATVWIDENSANGALVHPVSASDADAGDVLDYSIIAGNTNTAFAIDDTGQITVNNALALDFESITSFALTVRVSDKALTDDAVITVNLKDVNEPPVVSDAMVFIDENTVIGTTVHALSSSDPEGQSLTYTITAGNTATAFAVDNTGVISVNNVSALDYETTQSFTLTVTISDGTLSDDAVITINLNDLDDINGAPVVNGATVSLNENATNGTMVHTLSASDPDGDALTYAITAGNGNDIFAMSSVGVIFVNNSTAVDFETSPTFSLTVRVSDGQLFSEARITVNLVDINEPPSISNAVIKIREDVQAGTVVYQVSADDPDVSDVAVYSIESGNIGTAFLMSAYTGEVIVNNIEPINDAASLVYELLIMVTDAGGLTSTATLTIEIEDVGEENGIDPLKGFSPNGDGINDFWLIKGIEGFPNNQVKVFNRWGNLVYEARHYDNQDIAWRGESNGRLGGGHAPETTYYFLITVEGLEPITGYVVMK